MTGKPLLGGLFWAALIIGVLFGVAHIIVAYGELLLKGAAVLLGLGVLIWLGSLPAAPMSPEEQERNRRNFRNYQIAQDLSERREAHREQMAQWRQAQQPPPRSDPGGFGGDCSGRGGGRWG